MSVRVFTSCVWLVAILFKVPVAASSEPQNGDVRLANGTSLKGRLEVYWNEAWGTVCYDPDDYTIWEKGAARAACRQLGYEDSVNVGTVVELNIPEAPSDTHIIMYDLNCPYPKDANLNNVAQHVLRCTYDLNVNCSHSQDMAIECSSTSRYANPYDTDVRLVKFSDEDSGFPSSGVVEVYLNGRWGSVCSISENYYNRYFADSVCQQLGYTGASSFSNVDQGSIPGIQPSLNYDNEYCVAQSSPCASGCFVYPSTLITVTCVTGSILTATCTFNVNKRDSRPAGSEELCAPTNTISNLKKIAIIVGSTVGGLAVLAVFIVTLILCCCFIPKCPLHSWRERKFYETIN